MFLLTFDHLHCKLRFGLKKKKFSRLYCLENIKSNKRRLSTVKFRISAPPYKSPFQKQPHQLSGATVHPIENPSQTEAAIVYFPTVFFSNIYIFFFFFTRPHYRPKSPPTQISLSSHSSSPVSSNEPQSVSKQSGEPRPRLHRSFSTQPRSKFSLNPTPTNGVVGPNFTHTNMSRSSLSNGPLSNQGGYTTGTILTKNSAYSTAPVKAVYAMNFPVNSNISGPALVRGSAPFSPTALSSSSSSSAALRANAVESSGVEQM